jgi:hypothetical protein
MKEMTPQTQSTPHIGALPLDGNAPSSDMSPSQPSSLHLPPLPLGERAGEGATKEAVTMRAEAQTLVTEIEESLELLRRRL